MITKLNSDHTKALSDQIRVSVTQAILQVVGKDNIIRITDGSLTADKLEPQGQHLTLKLSIDVYPDNRVNAPNPNS